MKSLRSSERKRIKVQCRLLNAISFKFTTIRAMFYTTCSSWALIFINYIYQ